MNVARILFPIHVLGPGSRIGIWVVGCHRKCKECSNPELWEAKSYYEIKVEDLIKLVTASFNNRNIDGFIITGGEPFNQSKDLLLLLEGLEALSDDIIVYTGYLYEELANGTAETKECLKHIGVLIDGPYIDELNTNVAMRGSSNQKIYVLKEHLKDKYHKYLNGAINCIQNFSTSDGIVSVGIHKRRFKPDLYEQSKVKGVIFNE